MRFGGGDLDDLIRDFDRMNNTIDDNVDPVLHENAVKFSTDTVKTAKEVMNKGYWTGNLARMVEDAKEGHLKYGITSKAKVIAVLLNSAPDTWNQKRSCSQSTKSSLKSQSRPRKIN